MTAAAIKAGQAFVEISARDKKLQDTLAANKERLAGFVQSVAKVGAALAVGTIVASIKRFASFGDQMDKMSQRTGFAVEALSELKFAAEQNGSSIEQLESGIRRMNGFLLDAERGTARATKTLDALGVSFSELQSATPDDRLSIFAEAISQVEDSGRRTALMMQVFGRSSTQLLPLLQQGADGIRQFREEARELGLTMSGEQATAAAELADAWNRLTRALEALMVKIGAGFAPMITNVANVLATIAANNTDAVLTFAKLATVLVTVGAAATAVFVALKAYSQAVIVARALSGPAGWITLGLSLSAVAVAVGAVDSALGNATDSLSAATGEAGELSGAIDQIDTGEAVEQLDNLANAAGRVRDARDDLVDSTDQIQKLLDSERTGAEKLNAQLDTLAERQRILNRLRRGGRNDDDRLFNPQELEELRSRLIDSATGFKAAMQSARDEIGKLNGTLTETDVKLRKMAEKGLPAPELEEYKAVLNRLDAARTAADNRQDAAAEQEELRRQQRAQRDAEFQRLQLGAEQIKDAMLTPAERFAERIMEMREMIRAGVLNRETANAFLSQQLREREQQRNQAAANFRRQNSVDIRDSRNTSILTDLLNGTKTADNRKLQAAIATAKNTQEMAEAISEWEGGEV